MNRTRFWVEEGSDIRQTWGVAAQSMQSTCKCSQVLASSIALGRTKKAAHGSSRQLRAVQGSSGQFKAAQGSSRRLRAVQGSFKAARGGTGQFKAALRQFKAV